MKRSSLHIEHLETRSLLASGVSGAVPPPSLTLQITPSSDPAHDGVVFQNRLSVSGETTPRAIVQLAPSSDRRFSLRTRADAAGHFQFTLKVPDGQTTITARAIVPTGQQATASLNVTCGNSVINWNAAALQAIRVDNTPPPQAARNLAMVQAAVFDAVNAIVPTAEEYHATLTARSGSSIDAAVAQAAHDVLMSLYPRQASTFDAELAASLARPIPGPSLKQGIAVGRSAAQQILAWRSNDGANAHIPYTPGTAPGQWRPTPPGFLPALDPQWPDVTPFAMITGSQFRPGPPPALGSPDYNAAVSQVESLGGVDSTTRTPDQTQIALFWSDGAGTDTPPGHWNAIAEQVAMQEKDSVARDARLFAQLDIALADAGIAAWDAKYAYNFWRPITVIQQTDPTWKPLITTPNFPSYVSGHSTFSGAAEVVLSSFFGPNVTFSATSDGLPGVTRTFTSFAQAADEAGMSRIYGGIHYSFDNTTGLAMGRALGQYVVDNVLLPPKTP
ncbi:MAG: phosphatase PAP2 family protein [Planctomycetaceae bacterium]|nr:phosphatase PAP2 family protein [Planctomycetaceae bacterium]